MSNEFLSQEEVDALLRGVSGEAEETATEESTEGIRPYNLATQERIVRGRMPTLEIINERFARNLRLALFNFMRRTPELTVSQARTTKYSEFIRTLAVPTNINVVHMRPLRGSTLFVIEPKLVFMVIDNLFGGGGRIQTRVEGRDFTLTEQRIIQRVLELIFENYEKAWATIYPVKFEYVRSEMHTQFANIATPSEIMVTMNFNIEFGGHGGDFHVCIPYSSLEPIRDMLSSSVQGDAAESDRRWVRLLSRQVQGAEVDMATTLGHANITISQLLKMKAGDVIMLDIPENVVADVDGVPVFECKYGTMNGQYAIKVNKILSIPEVDNFMEEEHG